MGLTGVCAGCIDLTTGSVRQINLTEGSVHMPYYVTLITAVTYYYSELCFGQGTSVSSILRATG